MSGRHRRTRPTTRERLAAFKDGSWPYCNEPPGADLSPDEREAIAEATSASRLHAGLALAAKALPDVYGSPHGSPRVRDAIMEAKRLLRDGDVDDALDALQAAAEVTGCDRRELARVVREMRGAPRKRGAA